MSASDSFDINEWLRALDLAAIPDPNDKVCECRFFFELASRESDRARFRWLVSAFLNAAYSFFESSALTAFYRFTDPGTAEPREDGHALEVLRKYVGVDRKLKRQERVSTWGLVPLTKQLYEFRKKTTHHFSLPIMAAGDNLPHDFQFGNRSGQGTPVLSLCGDVLQLVEVVHREIEE